ncbi:MAG: squalene/phytoene synthase family protein [Myxococcales bacterium]|nr:squalene/phytoene synthase family protein [Myxococcales bacterium]
MMPSSQAPQSSPSQVDLDADWLWCKDALGRVSRTFSQPIAMLQPDLERAVTCGYLLCRLADTIEDDAALSLETRDKLYAAFLDVVDDRGAASDFGAIAAPLLAGPVTATPSELELFDHLPAIMAVLDALPALRPGVLPWVAEMTRGMAIYSHRKPGTGDRPFTTLLTENDLDRYCYFVAGTVGHMLTDLFTAALPRLSSERERVLRENAESFALGLQLTNILKDVTDDYERRVCFIPLTLLARHGIPQGELLEPAHRIAAHAAVAPIFDRASEALRAALTYALAIPPEAREIRLFCLTPLLMAVRTLAVTRGNDGAFEPAKKVKISREEVYAIIGACMRDVSDDTAMRSHFERLATS